MEKDLSALITSAKTGDEKLSFQGIETGYSLLDFWKWSVSDLMSNSTRGSLAEFIVCSALQLSPADLRNEWAPYDLLADGIRIEVKAAAYVQSWAQRKPSSILFSIKPARFWNSNTGLFEGEAGRHSDVYVFCLLHHHDQKTIDPLKLEQWEFYVLPMYCLNDSKQITLSSLRKLTEPVQYSYLEMVIRKAAAEQQLQKDELKDK